MKPKEALEELWKANYFKEYRQKKELEKYILKKFGCTCANWHIMLKLSGFLRKDKEGWIQKYPFENDEGIEVYYFEPDKPRTSRQNFNNLLSSLKGDVKICDPYLTKDTLEALEQIKNADVKFLTCNKKDHIKVSSQEIKDFEKENPKIEIKGFVFDHLHDRYIIAGDKLLLLGHGFSVRNKESFIIELPEKFAKDLIQSLASTFDIRWKNNQNVSY